MNVTIEEFKGLVELAGYYSTPIADRYNHSLTEHLMEEVKIDRQFKRWLKTHYPEALQEWNAIQKIKGEGDA